MTTVKINRNGRGELYGYVGDAFVIAWPRFGAWSWSAIRTIEDEPGQRTETERIASGEGVGRASTAIAEAIDAAAKARGLTVTALEVEASDAAPAAAKVARALGIEASS